jgi:hypothetical protein
MNQQNNPNQNPSQQPPREQQQREQQQREQQQRQNRKPGKKNQDQLPNQDPQHDMNDTNKDH